MPFSWIYGEIMNLRNALYARGIVSSSDLGAPTISVGNITAGGTGKTPLVAMIAASLLEKGEKVCILTRGYGRRDSSRRVVVADGESILADAETGGDEPCELAAKLNGRAVIIADADRVAAAEFAMRSFSPTVFLLDDGFQHQRARRDLDIVLIDATNPFGGGATFPFGRLREPLANLRRADLIVITRTETAETESVSQIRRQIEAINSVAPLLESRTVLSRFTTRDGSIVDASELAEKQAFAFSGIGNPRGFLCLLESNGLDVSGWREYRDHMRYAAADVAEINVWAGTAPDRFLVTTAKDAVKLGNAEFSLPLLIAETHLEINEPAILQNAIGAALNKHRADQV